jgi:hypothetical protein
MMTLEAEYKKRWNPASDSRADDFSAGSGTAGIQSFLDVRVREHSQQRLRLFVYTKVSVVFADKCFLGSGISIYP